MIKILDNGKEKCYNRIMKMKICTGKCKRELPATMEFFYKDKSRKDGLEYRCKDCSKKKSRKYSQSEEGKTKKKEYRQSERGKEVNKKAVKKYSKTEKGKGVKRKAAKNYRQSERGKERKKVYYEKNKLSHNISSAIRKSLNGNKGNRHWEDIVDFTLQELKEHLESLFQERMIWDNYGQWHIDHKRPVSSFNITDYECEDFKECWSLENLQPLWAEENMKKGSKWNE